MDALYMWCNRFENKDRMDSLLKSEYSSEFIEICNAICKASVANQIEYLTRVFSIIEQNDEAIIQRHLEYNIKISYDWCMRFNVPISKLFMGPSISFPATEESQND
jgi:hypothetical protein